MPSIRKWVSAATWAASLSFLSACNQNDIEPLAIGEHSVSTFEQNLVMAKGIWRIDGEQSASPINLTEIFCWKDQMTCRMVSANVSDGNGGRYLGLSQSVVDVTSWTGDSLTFREEFRCRQALTTISRADRSVVQTITPDLDAAGCEPDGQGGDALGIPILQRPRIVRMVTASELRRRRQSWLEYIGLD